MSDQPRPLITVFTPSYNRAHTLPRLYDSLLRQADHGFEWLLVDDGSSDGTRELAEQWVAGGTPFEFRYHRVANGGKPRAITLASRLARGEYLFIVDSDDYLADGAIEMMTRWIGDSRADSRCVGVGGVRGWESHSRPQRCGDSASNGAVRCTNLQRKEFGILGEMNETYRVEILRQYPFRVWPGENFVPEQVIFDQMALDGWHLHWYDEVVCIGDYQDDGLTANADRLEARNPMGYAMLANHTLKYARGGKAARAAVQHIALSLVGGSPRYVLESNRPWLTAALVPLGVAMSFRRRRQFARRLHAGGDGL